MYDTATEKSLLQQGGSVGVIFDGSMLFSAFAGGDALTSYSDSAPAIEGDTFDMVCEVRVVEVRGSRLQRLSDSEGA